MLLEDSIIIPSWHCYKCFIANFSCVLNSGQILKPSRILPSVPPYPKRQDTLLILLATSLIYPTFYRPPPGPLPGQLLSALS